MTALTSINGVARVKTGNGVRWTRADPVKPCLGIPLSPVEVPRQTTVSLQDS